MTAETVTRTKVRCPLGNPAHAREEQNRTRRAARTHGRAARERGPRPRGGAHAAELVRLVRLDLAAEPERRRPPEGLHDVCDANEYLMDADENLGLDWDGSDASNVPWNDHPTRPSGHPGADLRERRRERGRG